MTLRTRLYLLIAFLIAGSATVLYTSARGILRDGFDELELEHVQAHIDSAKSALADQLQSIAASVRDNAQWDDAYTYGEGKNPCFPEENYPAAFVRQLDVDAVILTDSQGKILSVRTSSNDSGQPVPLPADLISRLTSLGIVSALSATPTSSEGIVAAGEKVYLVAASPIVRSDGSGSPTGKVVFARELDQSIIQRAAKSTGLKLTVTPLAPSKISPQAAAAQRALQSGRHYVVNLPSEASAVGYALLNNNQARPDALLQITTDRSIHLQALSSSYWLLAVTVTFMLLFAAIALAIWNKAILHPLNRLSSEVKTIGADDQQVRLTVTGRDEVSAVANLLNSSLDRLRQSRDELDTERERLAVTLASIGDAVVATDADMKITFINKIAEKITGWPSADAVGRDVSEVLKFLSEQTRQPVDNRALLAIKDGAVVELPSPCLLVCRNGSEVPVDDSAAPIIGSDGAVQGCIIVLRDVTKQRAADAKLRESQNRMATLWNAVQVGVAIVDAQTHKIVDTNDVAARLVGYEDKEVIGTSCHQSLCTASEGCCPMEAGIGAMDRRICKLRTASGELLDIMKTVTRIELDGHPHYLETFVDISERIQIEDRLMETAEHLQISLARNRAILENSSFGVVVTNGSRQITEANGKMAEMAGCAVHDLVGQSILGFFQSEEQLCQLEDKAKALFRSGQEFHCEHEAVRSDGTVIWCELSGRAIDPYDLSKGIVWVVLDITKRKRAINVLEMTQYATDKASDMVIWVDSEGRLKYVNEATCQSLGYSKSELLNMSLMDFDARIKPETWTKAWNDAAENGALTIQTVHKTKNGRLYPVEVSANYREFGDTKFIFAYARDISKRVEDEAQMRLQVSAMNAASDHILILDTKSNIVFANKAFQEHSGYSAEEVVRENPRVTLVADKVAFQAIWNTVKNGRVWTGELPIQKKNGERYISELTVTPVADQSGMPGYFVAIARDITDRKSHEQMLDRQAKQDLLTGLPNRLVFNETLTSITAGHRRSDDVVGVMFIDLDKFKSVNDTLGHDAGDLLLVEASDRLKGCIRDTDMLCRMGGDEFTIILRKLDKIEDAKVVADRILSELRRPFVIVDHEFNLGASIGISIYPRDAADFTGIVKSADIAMYRAKEQGRNNYQFYSTSMDAQSTERMKMERDLRSALGNGELEVYYQPRIDPVSRKLIGAESLLRWNHPTRGLVPAAEFIPLAEETGLIMPIGDYVLDSVLTQIAKWRVENREPIRIAVNLSEKHAYRTEFLSGISQLLASYDIPPSCLGLELPGKAFHYISEQALSAIEELRQTGVQFTLDDFSNGPLPLTILNRIPVDCLKIDGALMTRALDSKEDAGVVASICATARNLGMHVVAVGIESIDHLELATSLMCDEAQGYLIGSPMPAGAFAEFRRNYKSHPTKRKKAA